MPRADSQGPGAPGVAGSRGKKGLMPKSVPPNILKPPKDSLPLEPKLNQSAKQSSPTKLTPKVRGRIPDNPRIKMLPVVVGQTKPKAVYDWPGLFTAYRTAASSNKGLELKSWCASNDLADKYGIVRKNFNEMSRQLAGDRLALCAPNAAKRLSDLLDSEDEDVSLKASTAVLDRTGFSPQQVAVTINQQTVMAVSIPPLLREDYSKDIKSFIDATEARDDE